MYHSTPSAQTTRQTRSESYDARARRIRSEAFHAGLSGITRLFRGSRADHDKR